ncbi:hypothetical protein [Mesorhizobium xinjiangense]|uniref:hypothetical protein n=1 Tax=Mesorhizobium xinjiangense TaxID=2678685 RepID=UPI0012ED1C24|nr:hypothetical protein [Mesorhizobium xinjiangense]
MSILSTISHLAVAVRERRSRARTERIIGTLPADIRKDIGWPDTWDRRAREIVRNPEWYGR